MCISCGGRIAALVLIISCGIPCPAWAAQPPQLLAPTQLAPALRGTAAGQKLDSVFYREVQAQRTRSVSGFRPASVAAANVPAADTSATVADPVTSTRYKVGDVVKGLIAVQQSYLRRTGRQLVPIGGRVEVDLDDLATGPSEPTISYGASGPAQGSTPALPVAATKPSVASYMAGATTSSTCPAPSVAQPSVANDLQQAWDAIAAYRRSASKDICSLGRLGDLIKSAAAQPQQPNPLQTSFPFGNPSTAQGVFSVTPTIGSDATGTFSAAIDANFSLTILGVKQPSPILDANASVKVPAKGSVTSTVTVQGLAFGNNSRFDSSNTLGPANVTFTGTHQAPLRLLNISQTWPITGGSVTASVDVDGQADLGYKLLGDNQGLFATVTPSLSAALDSKVMVNAVLCLKCTVEANFTVENSNASTIGGLLADVPYDGHDFSVERLYAHYAPWDYKATIEVYGHALMVVYFHHYLMQTAPIPLTKGFGWDSGWGVQQL